MTIRPRALVDISASLERIRRELDGISGDIVSTSHRLGRSSGMEIVQERLLRLSHALEQDESLIRIQAVTLTQVARWYELCELRVQDEYEGAAIHFPHRESTMLDVSFVSNILR